MPWRAPHRFDRWNGLRNSARKQISGSNVQIFFKENLAILAVPKTGTTAYERTLRPHADIVFAKGRKHMTAGQYHNKTSKFLRRLYGISPEVLAVMRNPLEQLRSWYRYRSRLANAGHGTAGISFDAFVEAVLQDDPPLFAQIGSQHHFLTLRDGRLPVHHLFAYENQNQFRKFLCQRFDQQLEFRPQNVSPAKQAPLSPEIEARLRQVRAKEFELYQRLRDSGGYLHQQNL